MRRQCPACRYIYDHDAKDRGPLEDEPFIQIKGSFFAQTSEPGYTSDGVDEVWLYACPKCGTVRMFHWGIPDTLRGHEG